MVYRRHVNVRSLSGSSTRLSTSLTFHSVRASLAPEYMPESSYCIRIHSTGVFIWTMCVLFESLLPVKCRLGFKSSFEKRVVDDCIWNICLIFAQLRCLFLAAAWFLTHQPQSCLISIYSLVDCPPHPLNRRLLKCFSPLNGFY